MENTAFVPGFCHKLRDFFFNTWSVDEVVSNIIIESMSQWRRSGVERGC